MYQLLALAILFMVSLGWIMALASGTQIEWEIYIMGVLLTSLLVPNLFLIIDEIYQTEDLFASMPVNRKLIVYGKYGSTILQIILVLGIHLLGIHLGVFFFGGGLALDIGLAFDPLIWIVILILLLLFISFFFPFIFKFGLVKGAIIFGIIQLSLLILGFIGLITLNSSLNPGKFLQPLFNWISPLSNFTLYIGLIAFLLFVIGGSIACSSKVYKNKDI